MQNRNAQEDIVEDIISVLDEKKYSFNPTSVIGINDNEIMAMTFIVSVLKYYPFCGYKLLLLGLRCDSMYPRNAAISTIEEWSRLTKISIEDFPEEIYNTLEALSRKEVIKKYKEKINKLLGVDEDLSNYKEPRIELYVDKNEDTNEDDKKIGDKNA